MPCHITTANHTVVKVKSVRRMWGGGGENLLAYDIIPLPHAAADPQPEVEPLGVPLVGCLHCEDHAAIIVCRVHRRRASARLPERLHGLSRTSERSAGCALDAVVPLR